MEEDQQEEDQMEEDQIEEDQKEEVQMEGEQIRRISRPKDYKLEVQMYRIDGLRNNFRQFDI